MSPDYNYKLLFTCSIVTGTSRTKHTNAGWARLRSGPKGRPRNNCEGANFLLLHDGHTRATVQARHRGKAACNTGAGKGLGDTLLLRSFSSP